MYRLALHFGDMPGPSHGRSDAAAGYPIDQPLVVRLLPMAVSLAWLLAGSVALVPLGLVVWMVGVVFQTFPTDIAPLYWYLAGMLAIQVAFAASVYWRGRPSARRRLAFSAGLVAGYLALAVALPPAATPWIIVPAAALFGVAAVDALVLRRRLVPAAHSR